MSKIILSLSILSLLTLGFLYAGGRLIDSGQEVFFPKELGSKLTAYKDFPVTWWNFLVWDLGQAPDAQTWIKLEELCKALKSRHSGLVKSLECRQDIIQYKDIVQDWIRDLPLRQPLPDEGSFEKIFKKALTKASLPLGSEILSLLRQDPFESYEELIRLSSEKAGIRIPRTEGFFYDPALHRIVVPVQFSFPPERDSFTREFLDAFSELCKKDGLCTPWALLGPHGSTLENKAQIMSDMNKVTTVGLIALAGFGILLIKIKRVRLLLLIPPVLFAFALTVGITALVFQKVHGLTMAFGIGNIGLSVDYGLHTAFNVGKKGVWKSNLVCFFTTAIALVILSFSKTPLISQLMFFSLCGLTIATVIVWGMFRWFADRLQVEPFDLRPAASKAKALVVTAVFVVGISLSLGLSPNMNLSAMDYQSEDQRMFRKWIYENLDKRNFLFEINETSPNPESSEWSQERLQWAKSRSIKIENAALYLPNVETQQRNLATWKKFFCSKPAMIPSPGSVERQFFAPFFETFDCQSLTERGPDRGIGRSYLSGFFSQGKEIGFWFPANDFEKNLIVQKYPQANSLQELSNIFPKILINELKWMAPLSLVAIWLLLLAYYRRISLTFTALIPFFTGVGLIFCCIWLFKSELSFITLFALVMVYGISVDYGIFSTDLSGRDERVQNGLWSAMLFSGITTVGGFIPLVFSKHPVLIQLGQTVSLGIVGALLGAFWGVPYFIKKIH
jgi:hypothetical protein